MFETVALSAGIFCTIVLVLALIFFLNAQKKPAQALLKLGVNNTIRLEVAAKQSLLEALYDHDIFLPSACSGLGNCSLCACTVVTDHKRELQLACQLQLNSNTDIEIPDEFLHLKKYHAHVLSNENVTPFIKCLRVKLDRADLFHFSAGAYVQIQAPVGEYAYKNFIIDQQFAAEWDRLNLWQYKAVIEKAHNRAYSLASYPGEEGGLLFYIRISPPPLDSLTQNPGACSSYLFSLKSGDKLSFTGPFGDFLLKPGEKELVYIGGGAGMAPIRSHIFDLLKTQKSKRKVTFFYGARSVSDSFYTAEFQQLEKEFANFHYVLALSEAKSSDQWQGARGMVHEVAIKEYLANHTHINDIEFYLCGPPAMIEATRNALHLLSVTDEMICYDQF